MIKKLLRWGVTATLIAGLAFISLAPLPAISSEEKVMNLTLEQALKLAEDNNRDIKAAQLARDKKELSLDQAKDNAEAIDDEVGENGGTYEMGVARDVAPLVAQRAFDSAKLDYDISVNAVKIKVISAYYDLQSAQNTLAIKRNSAANSHEMLKQVEAKFKVGTAAKLDVDGQKVTTASDDAAVAQAEQNVKVSQLNLNKMLSLPVGQQVNPVSPVKLNEQSIDYDKSLAKALVEDPTLRGADLTAYQAELTLKSAKEYSSSVTYTYKLANSAYQSALLNLEGAKYDVNSNVLAAYNNLQNAKRTYDILASQVKVAEDTARLTRLRYQVGMATLYEVNNASTQLEQVKQNYQSAIVGYNLAAAQFEYGIFGSASAAGSGM